MLIIFSEFHSRNTFNISKGFIFNPGNALHIFFEMDSSADPFCLDNYFNGIYIKGEVTQMNASLKVVRENLKLTQQEVSNLIGIPINTLRNWEQESRTPSSWALNLLIDRMLREINEQNRSVDESTGILSFLTIKKVVSNVAHKYDIDRIYLFGSYTKGQAKKDSDVDLYMTSNLYGLEYFEFVEELREALNKKVEVLSNKTVNEDSKIEEQLKKTGILIYPRSLVH